MKRIIYGSLFVLTAVSTAFVSAKAEAFNAENSTSIQPAELAKTDTSSAIIPTAQAQATPAAQSGEEMTEEEITEEEMMEAGPTEIVPAEGVAAPVAPASSELAPVVPTPAPPGLAAPELTEPEPIEPALEEPEPIEPDLTEPDLTEPDLIFEPDISEPELTEPGMTAPGVTPEPEMSDPSLIESDMTEPGLTGPPLGESELDESEDEEALSDEPVSDEPITDEGLPPVPQESISPVTPGSPLPQAPEFPSAPVEPPPGFPSTPVEPAPLPPLENDALEDSAVPSNEFPVGASSSDRLVGEGFTPFQLSYLAIAGGLKEEGIPGGSILLSAYSQGDISAADIVDAGALSNRLGTAADDQADYTDGVDRLLELLERDARSD